MFKELFLSLSGNFQRRIRNPFLGTFAVVWMIYYWKPLYAILSFSEEDNYRDRIAYLEVYFGEVDFFVLLELIGITFLALLLTYLLLAVSKLLANTFQNTILTFIDRLTDKNSIISRERYDILEANYSLLNSKHDQIKKWNDELIQNLESVNTKFDSLTQRDLKNQEELQLNLKERELLTDKIAEYKDSIKTLQSELRDIKNLEPRVHEMPTTVSKVDSLSGRIEEFEYLYEYLLENKIVESIISVMYNKSQDEPIYLQHMNLDTRVKKFLEENSFFTVDGDYDPNEDTYFLTPLGSSFLLFLVDKYLSTI